MKTENLQSDILMGILSTVKDDRALVLLTHGYLELAVTRIIDRKCKNASRITSDTRGYPYSVRIVLLHELGLLTDSIFIALDRFRKIRNRAAHEPYFKLRKDQLKLIVEHYEKDRNPGPAQPHTLPYSANIRTVCLCLVAMIFKEHSEIINEAFTPERWREPGNSTEQNHSGDA